MTSPEDSGFTVIRSVPEPDVYNVFDAVADIVWVVDVVTVGAVYVVVKSPFALVVPLAKLRLPPVTDTPTVAPFTLLPPDVTCTVTWEFPPEVTGSGDSEMETVSVEGGGDPDGSTITTYIPPAPPEGTELPPRETCPAEYVLE